jgi:apolipoprotein N-acyltransferase
MQTQDRFPVVFVGLAVLSLLQFLLSALGVSTYVQFPFYLLGLIVLLAISIIDFRRTQQTVRLKYIWFTIGIGSCFILWAVFTTFFP